MKTKPLAIKIATLTRKIKETEDVTAKKTLKTKLAVLKKQLSESKEDTNIKSENLSKAKIQVDKMTKKDFNEYIKKLSKNEDYKFLGLMTKEEIVDDIKEVAKPVGWRFRGNNNRVPSKKQVTLGRKSGEVYYENRSNRSDVSRVVRLEKGGFITDKKNSEISIGTWLLNSPDGRKMIKKSKNSNELENNAIEYMKSGDIISSQYGNIDNKKINKDIDWEYIFKNTKYSYKMEDGGGVGDNLVDWFDNTYGKMTKKEIETAIVKENEKFNKLKKENSQLPYSYESAHIQNIQFLNIE
jgi:hypothetical protein